MWKERLHSEGLNPLKLDISTVKCCEKLSPPQLPTLLLEFVETTVPVGYVCLFSHAAFLTYSHRSYALSL